MSIDSRADRPPDRAGLAERIAAAAGGVAGVVRLGHGGAVEAATYQRTRKITGVVLGSDQVVVHIQVNRVPLQPIVAAVSAAAADVLTRAGCGGHAVRVCVADLHLNRLPSRTPETAGAVG